jgi:hypothetical protein
MQNSRSFSISARSNSSILSIGTASYSCHSLSIPAISGLSSCSVSPLSCCHRINHVWRLSNLQVGNQTVGFFRSFFPSISSALSSIFYYVVCFVIRHCLVYFVISACYLCPRYLIFVRNSSRYHMLLMADCSKNGRSTSDPGPRPDDRKCNFFLVLISRRSRSILTVMFSRAEPEDIKT